MVFLKPSSSASLYQEQRLPTSRNTKHSGLDLVSLRKKGLIKVEGNSVIKIPGTSTEADETALDKPTASDPRTKEFIKRGILQESETVRYVIAITPAGHALFKKGLDLREESGTLTRDQILTGTWKTVNLRRYDVSKVPKKAYPR